MEIKFPRLPLDQWVESFVKLLDGNLGGLFQGISLVIGSLVDIFAWIFGMLPAFVFILLFSILAWKFSGRGVGLFTFGRSLPNRQPRLLGEYDANLSSCIDIGIDFHRNRSSVGNTLCPQGFRQEYCDSCTRLYANDARFCLSHSCHIFLRLGKGPRRYSFG